MPTSTSGLCRAAPVLHLGQQGSNSVLHWCNKLMLPSSLRLDIGIHAASRRKLNIHGCWFLAGCLFSNGCLSFFCFDQSQLQTTVILQPAITKHLQQSTPSTVCKFVLNKSHTLLSHMTSSSRVCLLLLITSAKRWRKPSVLRSSPVQACLRSFFTMFRASAVV